MVNVQTRVQTPGQRLKEKQARIREAAYRPGIRVEPANEKLRAVLKHPSGIRFRGTGSVEWPNDIFTRRRIADGSVKVVEERERERKAAPQHQHHSRVARERGE